jgi:hypothetical protein
MTDEDAGELFALARDSFRGGQTSFQIQAYPFRMTPENMARHRDSPNMDFWRMLKVGYDHFEVTQLPPKVDVCDKRYVFNAEASGAPFEASRACPAYVIPPQIATAVAAKEASDEQRFTQALALLEEESRKVSETRAAQEAKIAARDRAAAEKAAGAADDQASADSSPSLIDRLLGRNKPAEASVATIEPAALPDDFETGEATSVIASIPSPRTRPEAKAAAVIGVDEPPPALEPAPKAVVEPEPDEPEPEAAAAEEEPLPEPAAASGDETPKLTTPESPPVGRFVKGKKFLWPDES